MKRTFQDIVENILYWGIIRRRQVAFFSFTVATETHDPDVVMMELKKLWALFIQHELWRRIEHAVWVFADHKRPHIHLVAEMPAGISFEVLLQEWPAADKHGRRVFSSLRLGAYLAVQWKGHGARGSKRPERRRYWGVKRQDRRPLGCMKALPPSPQAGIPSIRPDLRFPLGEG